MRNAAILFALLVLGAGARLGTAQAVLENDQVRVVLDTATGGFASLFDKERRHEHVTAPDRSLLVRLMTPGPGEDCLHLEGTAPQIGVSGNRATVTFDWEGIRAAAVLELRGDELTASLRVENVSGPVVEEIMFPWVRGIGEIPDGAFVWPHFFRRRYNDVFGKDLGGDHRTWNELTQKLSGRYPAHLATAWCDYGSTRQGIGIEARHTDFSITDFHVHKVVEKDRHPVRRSLDLATVFTRRVRPGETHTTPPVVISVHGGDWHSVAGRHRDFLDPWIGKPERPDKFAEAVGWHFYFMKHQDGHTVNRYEDLPRMARASLDAGCPYLLVFGWQTGGHDNNYCYRYVPNEDWGGAEALRAALAECREMGAEVIPFYNGTLANIGMPEHREFGHRWEAKTRAGHPYYAGDWARTNFDTPTRNRSMLHVELSFCREHREYFLETVRRMFGEYGFTNLQLDQISEKMFVDYDPAHVTTTPDRVFVDGLGELLPAVRGALRAGHPRGVIVGEAVNDFTGQWCDSFWDWNVLLPDPEPIFYTLPWLMGSHEVDALEYGEVNKAFACKLHLDMKIDGGDAPVTKYPDFAAHVRANAELRRRTAPYYVRGEFRDQDGIVCEPPENLMVKTYLNRSEGKFCIVAAETQGRRGEVRVRAAHGKRFTGVVESNQRPKRILMGAPSVRLSLAPREVAVVCADDF